MAEGRTFASISRVQGRLRSLLEPALNAKPFWLRAELSSVNHSKGRLYCDLVELKNGRVVAKLRCTIWPRDLTEIKKRLQASRLDELLEDGNEVGLRCTIQYHELYGMSVNAVDIDPNESLGALERKKQEIIQRLTNDKLIGKNALRPLSKLPKRIGLVASRGTAGYKDFVATIESSGYGMILFAADARVEGDDTERSVLRALQQLATLDLDLVVILRGGGSRVSLSYLDNEAIARAIAEHRYPVWTAIGHEIDTSVIDAVAHTSFKTPTAVAEFLVARYVEAEEELTTATIALRRLAEARLRPERERIDSAGVRLQNSVERILRNQRLVLGSNSQRFKLLVQGRLAAEDARLAAARHSLMTQARQRTAVAMRALEERRKSLGKTVGRALRHKRDQREQLLTRLRAPTALNRIGSETQKVAAWQQILRAADPVRNLERGYALVYDSDNKLLRTSQSVSEGQMIRVRLADGTLISTVESLDAATTNIGEER